MKTLIAAFMLAAFTASAQNTNIVSGGVPTTPPTFPTNQVAGVASGSAVAGFALSLLPYWDKTMTNAYSAKELELIAAPLWKSATGSGSTPFLDIGADYFFTKNLGIGADMVTFGNGSGASDIDSGHFNLIGRKDIGNVAGMILVGGGRDKARSAWDAEAGVGLEFRYSNGIGLLVDTRYVRFVEKSNAGLDHEFLTRIGITLHF